VVAIPEAMAFLNVVSSPTAPITHLAIVLAPSMKGMVANSNLSSASSLAFEVRSLVHVIVDVSMNAGYGISSGKAF